MRADDHDGDQAGAVAPSVISGTNTDQLTLLDRVDFLDLARGRLKGQLGRMAVCAMNTLHNKKTQTSTRYKKRNISATAALDESCDLVALSGVALCGCHYCPVCGPQKGRRFEERVQAIMESVEIPLYMVVLTVSNRDARAYGESLDAFATVLRDFRKAVTKKSVVKVAAWVIEPLFVESVWHIHAHLLMVAPALEQKAAARHVSELWSTVCGKRNLKTDPVHGAWLDLVRDNAASYMAKTWSPIARRDVDGGLTPFELFCHAREGCVESLNGLDAYLLASAERKGFFMTSTWKNKGTPLAVDAQPGAQQPKRPKHSWKARVNLSQSLLRQGDVGGAIRAAIQKYREGNPRLSKVRDTRTSRRPRPAWANSPPWTTGGR